MKGFGKGLGKAGFSCLALFSLLFAVLLSVSVYAVDSQGVGTGGVGVRTLTDMFNTKTFSGSAEALSKANVIGMIMHYAISWFSFLGLCLTLYQKFITLLYLSSRNLFDTVYEIKTSKMKGAGLGYGELFKSLFVAGENGRQGGGLDVFITFVYSLLPNVKAYSDYCPEKLAGNLKEEDGSTQYMLKTAIPTIMLVFFLTIGYSGTLGKAYGTVVDGMAVAADHVVSYNLASYVRKLVGENGAYTFSLAATGTEGGKYAQNVAEEMYNKILSMCVGTDAEFQQSLGKVIEDSVYGEAADGGQWWGVPATNSPSESLLGGKRDGYETLTKLAQINLPSAMQEQGVIQVEADVKRLKSPQVYDTVSDNVIGGSGLTWSIDDLMNAAVGHAAGGSQMSKVSRTSNAKYVHVVVKINPRTADYITPDAQQRKNDNVQYQNGDTTDPNNLGN